MATVKFDVVAKAGTYRDRDGNEKTRHHKCGVVFESDKGLSLKLESLPIGFDGWLSFYDPKPKTDRAPASQRSESPQGHQGGDGFGDESIPF